MPAFVHKPMCYEVGEVEEGGSDGGVDGAGFLHVVGEVQGDLGLESSLLFAKCEVVGVGMQGFCEIVKNIAFGASGGVHRW